MITNFETNKVYIAEGLKFPLYSDAANSLGTAFRNAMVKWEELPFSQSPLHIWARDYMPYKQVC